MLDYLDRFGFAVYEKEKYLINLQVTDDRSLPIVYLTIGKV